MRLVSSAVYHLHHHHHHMKMEANLIDSDIEEGEIGRRFYILNVFAMLLSKHGRAGGTSTITIVINQTRQDSPVSGRPSSMQLC